MDKGNKEIEDAAQIAAEYVNSTNRNIFLTGRAGTGKTTFLKEIVNNTHKNSIVAAPTGIAAINAGGVTLHSLFQLPLGIFIPSNSIKDNPEFDIEVQTPHSVMKHLRLNKYKRRLLKSLELLIIDEVSMLRADMADAIDMVLRTVRRKRNAPFGGVQLLLIGDMQQLPPVLKHKEREYLKPFYRSAYFFDANAFSEERPVYIELEKIYRQTDERFVKILNKLRDNQLEASDLKILNEYYYPEISEKQKEGAVFLTTHNKSAYEINKKKLEEINSKSHYFQADIEGEFPENNYPVSEKMELKKGAQIMFVKNDYSGEQRYFNGKIGKISFIDNTEIIVEFSDGSEAVELEKHTWENKRFKLNKKTQDIEEKVLGSFVQYPVRLAWAITVHKSQGLTFDKAIIDVSRVFAPGQAYVALSRLRSMDGLMLSKPLTDRGLNPDVVLSDFAKNKEAPEVLNEKLKFDAFKYTRDFLLSAFDLNDLLNYMYNHIKTYDKQESRSEKQKHKEWALSLRDDLKEYNNISYKFQNQIKRIMNSPENYDHSHLKERVDKAIEYFDNKLGKLLKEINSKLDDLDKSKGTKQFRNELKELEEIFTGKLREFPKSLVLMDALENNIMPDKNKITEEQNKVLSDHRIERKESSKKKKKSSSPSSEVSLKYYKDGKSPSEIAEIRGVKTETIESHLSQCVSKGFIPVDDFISKDCYKKVIDAYHKTGSNKLSDIRNAIDREYSYSEIRFAMSGYFADKKA